VKTETIAVNGEPIRWEVVASDNSEELSMIVIRNQDVFGRITFTEQGSVVVDYPGSPCLNKPYFKFKEPVELFEALREWKKMDDMRAECKEGVYRIRDDIQYLIARLLVTTDNTFMEGETTVDFFDKEGHYFSGITIRANGEIWIHTEGVNKDVKFKDPK